LAGSVRVESGGGKTATFSSSFRHSRFSSF
jgi:hypothetical protein